MRSIGRIVIRSFKTFFERDAFTNAAAISYYTIFSLPALLLLILNLAGAFYDEQVIREMLSNEFSKLIGYGSADVIISTIDNLEIFEPKWWATFISIFTILFTATTVFTTLQSALNKMFGVQANPDSNTFIQYLKSRLLSFGLIGGFAIILIVSLVLNSLMQYIGHRLSAILGESIASFTWTVSIIVPLLLNFAIFAMVFKILPDAKIKWRHTWLAAMITTGLFALGKHAITFFIARGDYGNIYGTAGSLLVVMVWIFYASLIVLFGAVLTKTIMTFGDGKVVASEFAEKKEADK